jgi:hypothetical protein
MRAYFMGLIYFEREQFGLALKEFEVCLSSWEVQPRVPREFIVKSLISTSMALGLEQDAERYREILSAK